MGDKMMLYWGSGSVLCWKAMIVLKEKGLGYKSNQVSFDKKEHKGEDVLKLNPRGELPAFKDGDVVVNESGAICDYLEYTYKDQGTKLFPDDPKERAKVLQRSWEANGNLSKTLMADLVMYFFRTKEEDRKEEELKPRQDAARDELAIWDKYLSQSGGNFVCGQNFTMADVVFFPFIAYCYRMGLDRSKFPNITAYYDRTKDRPSIKASWPPHWKEGDAKILAFKGI